MARRVGKILGSFRADDLDALRLVGREPELDALRTALERTTGGHGQLVEIVGEAGIGKSRLLQEVKTFAPDDMPWHTVACARYEASTPYFPFRPLLRALLGISEDLGHDQAAAVFAARVEQACPELMTWLPLLAVPTWISLSLIRLRSLPWTSGSVGSGWREPSAICSWSCSDRPWR